MVSVYNIDPLGGKVVSVTTDGFITTSLIFRSDS